MSSSPRTAGQVRRHQQRGRPGGGVGVAHLEHLRHRQQPADQAEQRGVHLVRPVTPVAGLGVDPDHGALPAGLGDEGLARPASREGCERGEVHASSLLPCSRSGRSGPSGSSAGPSTSPSHGGPTAPTGTATPTSTKPPTASSSATSGSCGVPRASPRPRRGSSRDVAGRDVLEVGSGAGQCSRWVAAAGRATRRPGPLPPSAPALPAHRRRHRRGGPVRGRHRHRPPVRGRVVRRGVLVLRRPAVRRRPRPVRRRDRAGAAARRPVRLLHHPPHALDVPRRPRRAGADGRPVLLGPDALRRGRRRDRRRGVRRAPPHAR